MRFAKVYTLLIIFLSAVAMANPYRRSQDILGLIGLGVVNFTLSIDKDSFDLKLSLLKKQMENIKTPASRLDLMRRTLREIQEARAVYPMLDDDVEIYMNLIVHSLEDLPDSSKFDNHFCPFYRKQMLSNYEPTALTDSGEAGAPEDPAIMQSLEILNLICR